MTWHYANNDQKTGPLTDEQFADAVREGVIRPETLVWREGMPDWIPFQQLPPQSVPEQPPLPPPVPAVSASGIFCAECGQRFPNEEMVNFSGRWVCPNCKPRFVQMLREGVNKGGPTVYASFWQRFGAIFLDGILLQIPTLPFTIASAMLDFSREKNHEPMTASYWFLKAVCVLIPMLIGLGYYVFMVGKYNATLGKMARGIKIVRPNGEKITYARALGRFFAAYVSMLTCYIGYFMVLWDEQKRALHDVICDTRVVRK